MTDWNIVAIVLGVIAFGMNIWVRVEMRRRRKRIERTGICHEAIKLVQERAERPEMTEPTERRKEIREGVAGRIASPGRATEGDYIVGDAILAYLTEQGAVLEIREPAILEAEIDAMTQIAPLTEAK